MGKNCTDCELHKGCTNSGIAGRALNSRPKYFLVLDIPTKSDDKVGRAPTGDVELKINYFLEKSGIDRNDVYVTHALKCFVDKQKKSKIKKEHLDACSQYLLSELEKYKPKAIITTGKHAFQMVSGLTSMDEFAEHDYDFSYETENDGKIVERSFKVFPTYGINASLFMWKRNGSIIRSFKKAQQFVKTGEIQITPDPYVNLVLSLEQLKDFEDRMSKADIVATDFETTGFTFWKDEIINSGYCAKDDFVDVIFHSTYKKKHIDKWDDEEIELAKKINRFVKAHKEEIRSTLKRVHAMKHIRWLLHNSKFDSKFAHAHEVPFHDVYWDSLVADPLIDENEGHSLNECYIRRGINYGPYDTKLYPYVGKQTQKTYKYIPPSIIVKYLGYDCAGLFKMQQIQEKELDDCNMLEHFLEIKMPSLKLLLEIEIRGVRYDKEMLLRSSKTLSITEKAYMEKIYELTGNREFNPNSDMQISKYMVEKKFPLKKLGIPETSRGFSTKAEYLRKLLDYPKCEEFIKLVLAVKKISKIKGTYIDGKEGDGGMLQYITSENTLHPNFNCWTATTGRYSCNRPSMQTFPRPIKGLVNTRQFIIKTNPDDIMFEADYSAVEQYVVAALSKDNVLIQKIIDGTDIHSFNAVTLGKALGWIDNKVTYEDFVEKCGKGKTPKDEIPKDVYMLYDGLRTKAKCLIGETNIFTSSGIKELGDLVRNKDDSEWLQKINLKVATGNGHEKAVLVNHKWVDSTIKIRSKYSDIEGDCDHRLLVWRDCSIIDIPLKNIKKGDYLIMPRNNEVWPKHNYKLDCKKINVTGNAVIDARLKAWGRSGKMTVPPKYPKTMNADLAMLYGLIVAEGNSVNLDIDMQEKDAIWEILPETVFRCFGVYPKTMSYHGGMKRLRFPTPIVRFFRKNGLDKRSFSTVRVPKQIMQSNRECAVAFLRAFFGGGGSGNKVEVGSEMLRKDIVTLLNNFNIFPVKYETWNQVPSRNKEKSLYFGLRMESYDFSVFSEKIGYLSERKNKKLRSMCKKDSRKVFGLNLLLKEIRKKYTKSTQSRINGIKLKLGESVHSQDYAEFTFNKLEKNKYILESLKTICDVTKEKFSDDINFIISTNAQLSEVREKLTVNEGKKVYDITVDHKDHNFIANGVLSKNCVGFGLNYGKGAKSFAEEFGISEIEAEEMISAYFGLYKKMKKWRDKTVETALKKGEISLLSGRKRRFHMATDWLNSRHAKRSWSARIIREEIERQAMNFPIQGGAHEVFEAGCLRTVNKLKEKGLYAHIQLSIHDGIVGSAKPHEKEMLEKIIKKEMIMSFNPDTPHELTLQIDVGFFKDRWYGEELKES
jgi:uracil-DNA glycosylase family 4